MNKKLNLLIKGLSFMLETTIKNKDLIIEKAPDNKLANTISKGLPMIVEYGPIVVKNLKTLK